MSENCSLAIVDNTDPDNLACVLALANAQVRHKLLGVIVTGRVVNFNPDAPLEVMNPVESQFVLKLNAVRMKKFLNTAGHGNLPVFVGNIPPHTIVPHSVHIDEREFQDLSYEEYRDLISFTPYQLDGSVRTASELVRSVGGGVDIIVGGPMTDFMWLMSSTPLVRNQHIRSVHAQFGSFGFGEKGLMEFGGKPRGKRQFNVACDPFAAHQVLMDLFAPVYLYPSDITRVDSLGFSNPDELANHLDYTPATRELVRIYRIAYEKMIKPRGERIYIHDLAPALGYLDMYPLAQDEIEDRGARAQKSLYRMKAVEVTSVPYRESEKDSWGEVGVDFNGCSPFHRYVATEVDSERYLRELRRFIR